MLSVIKNEADATKKEKLKAQASNYLTRAEQLKVLKVSF
jgi:hypothetical protein